MVYLNQLYRLISKVRDRNIFHINDNSLNIYDQIDNDLELTVRLRKAILSERICLLEDSFVKTHYNSNNIYPL